MGGVGEWVGQVGGWGRRVGGVGEWVGQVRGLGEVDIYITECVEPV